jgi:hypothetical protein
MRLENFYKIIYSELKKKKFQITLTGVKKALLEHPDYLSLQTITDYFDDMDIANTAVRIDFEQLLSAVTEAEVITLMNDEEGDNLLWIKKINSGKIHFANAKPVTFEEFQEKWQEKAILFKTKKVKMEENYSSNVKKESIWKRFFFVLLFGVLSLSIAYTATNHFSAFSILSLFPKFGGLLFAALLAAMELGFNLSITEKICSISTNKGCEKVTHSRISYLTENVKLADLGLIYFITTFLFLLSGNACLLAYIALFSIPLILFSIIYQSFVLKVFCPLCMSVMVMLVFDILIYWWGGLYSIFNGVSFESVLYGNR